MELNQGKANSDQVIHPRHAIYRTSIHSYSFYFVCLLIGVVFDFIFNLKIFNDAVMVPFGFVLLFLGTVLVVWSQISFVRVDTKDVTKEHFSKGPYRYIRNPTHWGVFFLVLGFGFITNAFFIVFFTILSHLLAKLIFVKKHERAMLMHFGAPYEEYKKSVKF